MPSGFAAAEGPLAAEYDVALLDLDGVVYVGSNAVDHAARSLDEARARHGMRAAFVTNNASRPPHAVAEHLRELGVQAGEADVVTSAQAGARVLAEQLPPGSNVLAVGGPGVAQALLDRGLVPVTSADDEPVAVIQGYGPDVGWRELAEASLVIGRGLVWVATNLDATIPIPRGRVLGNGALVAALRIAMGVEPLVAGKPEPPLMLESVERSGARHPLVVGDRLDTDIEGANRSGLASMLVLTGVTDWPELCTAPSEHRPTYLDRDLRGLLEAQPEVLVVREADCVVATCREVQVRIPVTVAVQHAAAVPGFPPAAGEPNLAESGCMESTRAESTRTESTHAESTRTESTRAESGPRPRAGEDPAWWLLPADRPVRGARSAELDVVRAALACAWRAMDEHLVVLGPASVRRIRD